MCLLFSPPPRPPPRPITSTAAVSPPVSSAAGFASLAEGAELPLIAAVGKTAEFGYHKSHLAATSLAGRAGGALALCRDPEANTGTIGGLAFNPKVCAPEW